MLPRRIADLMVTMGALCFITGTMPYPGPYPTDLSSTHVPFLLRPWVLLTFPLVASLLLYFFISWCYPRPLPARGGLPFLKSVQLEVPHFAQGDERWKEDLLGSTEATLHAEGCAVASAAMVLSSYGIDTDPGRLNEFLTGRENGYTPEGWIYWEEAAELAPGQVEKAYEDLPSYARIDWNLLRGNPVIIRVKLPENNHFVVIAGKKGREYLILDPGAKDEGEGKGELLPLSALAPQIDALRYYKVKGKITAADKL